MNVRALAGATLSLFLGLGLGLAACGDEDPAPGPSTSNGGSSSADGGSSSGTSGDASSSSSSSGGATGDGSVGSACRDATDCNTSLGLDCVKEIPAVPQVGFPGKTYPGGYCTKRCGQPNPDSTDPKEQNLSTDCGPNGVCMQSSQAGGGGSVSLQMCARSCTSNEDCRAADGYVCLAGAFGIRTCEAP